MKSGIVCRECGCAKEDATIFCTHGKKYHDWDYAQQRAKHARDGVQQVNSAPMPPLPKSQVTEVTVSANVCLDGKVIAEKMKQQCTVEQVDANKPAGLKYDSGKPMMSLIPYGPSAWMARAMEQGLYKYLRGNWQQLTGERNRHRIEDALKRHCDKLVSGEWTDPESKLPHAAHIMCNAAFLLWHHDAENGTTPDKLSQEQLEAMQEAIRIGEANRAKALAEASKP